MNILHILTAQVDVLQVPQYRVILVLRDDRQQDVACRAEGGGVEDAAADVLVQADQADTGGGSGGQQICTG